MNKAKISLIAATIACIAATAVAFYGLGSIDAATLQAWVRSSGVWAPLVYILLYIVATIMVLPSTILNLTGGALFGPWMGTLITSGGAIIAAIVAFAFARTTGREAIARRLAGRWQAMDAEVRRGGVFYMFAIRLVPVMPYGLLNFAAGLTSVSLKDYIIGTTLGTVPSVLPFVLLGHSGLQGIGAEDVLPMLIALGLTGILVGGSTWYRRRYLSSSSPKPTHGISSKTGESAPDRR